MRTFYKLMTLRRENGKANKNQQFFLLKNIRNSGEFVLCGSLHFDVTRELKKSTAAIGFFKCLQSQVITSRFRVPVRVIVLESQVSHYQQFYFSCSTPGQVSTQNKLFASFECVTWNASRPELRSKFYGIIKWKNL